MPNPNDTDPMARLDDLASWYEGRAEVLKQGDDGLAWLSAKQTAEDLRFLLADRAQLVEALRELSGAVAGLAQRTLDGVIFFEADTTDSPAVMAAWKRLDAAQKLTRQALAASTPGGVSDAPSRGPRADSEHGQ